LDGGVDAQAKQVGEDRCREVCCEADQRAVACGSDSDADGVELLDEVVVSHVLAWHEAGEQPIG
jgi:hypothetical protein